MYLRGPLLILPTAALAPGTQNDRRQPFHRSKPWDLERGTIAVSRSIVPNPGTRNVERSLSAVPSFQTLAPGTWNDRCQPFHRSKPWHPECGTIAVSQFHRSKPYFIVFATTAPRQAILPTGRVQFHSCFVASRAPSTSASSLAHMIVG